jgi:hypothetical protein
MSNDIFIAEILKKAGRPGTSAGRVFQSYNCAAKLVPFAGKLEHRTVLDHLTVSHSIYFPVLQKIALGEYKMNFWESYSPFSAKCGQLLKERVQEQVGKKRRRPNRSVPKQSYRRKDH